MAIKDRYMHWCEYHEAKGALEPQRKLIKRMKRSSPTYGKEFKKLLELLITVKGGAWCMDVKSERRKMSKLIVEEFLL